jgi:hypothetical protein
MVRLFLLFAMICQVLGCPYACTAAFGNPGDASPTVGCRCCAAKRLAQQNKQQRQLPANDERSESQTPCFCNSPVRAADAVQTDHDLVVSPLWTIVQPGPQLTMESVALVSGQLRPPLEDSGMGLRLVVQSLLL